MNQLSAIGALPLFLLLLLTEPLHAQMKGWEVGIWAGGAFYLGDLNTDFNFSDPNLAGGIGARYNFNDRLAVRLGANVGRVEGSDVDSKNAFERTRNLSFFSPLVDGTLQLEFNFLPYIHGSSENYYTPYVFGGVSAFYFNPKTELDGQVYELRPLGTEGQFRGQEYYTITGAFAYGVGIKYDLNYEWSLDFHLGMRSTFTDYLDDVSTVYPDRSDLQRARGDIAVLLSDRSLFDEPRDREAEQRGDSTNKDKYIFAGVGINYYFGDVRCPKLGSRKRRR